VSKAARPTTLTTDMIASAQNIAPASMAIREQACSMVLPTHPVAGTTGISSASAIGFSL